MPIVLPVTNPNRFARLFILLFRWSLLLLTGMAGQVPASLGLSVHFKDAAMKGARLHMKPGSCFPQIIASRRLLQFCVQPAVVAVQQKRSQPNRLGV